VAGSRLRLALFDFGHGLIDLIEVPADGQ
jgi:hypothetical protein